MTGFERSAYGRYTPDGCGLSVSRSVSHAGKQLLQVVGQPVGHGAAAGAHVRVGVHRDADGRMAELRLDVLQVETGRLLHPARQIMPEHVEGRADAEPLADAGIVRREAGGMDGPSGLQKHEAGNGPPPLCHAVRLHLAAVVGRELQHAVAPGRLCRLERDTLRPDDQCVPDVQRAASQPPALVAGEREVIPLEPKHLAHARAGHEFRDENPAPGRVGRAAIAD